MSATPFDFLRTPDADTNMTSLRVTVDNVTLTSLKKALGDPNPNSYVEEEKGYDGNEFTFTEAETGNVVNLYSRYSVWRVGAHSHDVAVRFATWLKEMCK